MIARFHELAATELDEAIGYYETKAEGLGDAFSPKCARPFSSSRSSLRARR
jgi:hypothetical protein